MVQAMIDFQNFSQFQSQNRVEKEKDMQTILNTFSEKNRKSTRPRFLSGR